MRVTRLVLNGAVSESHNTDLAAPIGQQLRILILFFSAPVFRAYLRHPSACLRFFCFVPPRCLSLSRACAAPVLSSTYGCLSSSTTSMLRPVLRGRLVEATRSGFTGADCTSRCRWVAREGLHVDFLCCAKCRHRGLPFRCLVSSLCFASTYLYLGGFFEFSPSVGVCAQENLWYKGVCS